MNPKKRAEMAIRLELNRAGLARLELKVRRLKLAIGPRKRWISKLEGQLSKIDGRIVEDHQPEGLPEREEQQSPEVPVSRRICS